MRRLKSRAARPTTAVHALEHHTGITTRRVDGSTVEITAQPGKPLSAVRRAYLARALGALDTRRTIGISIVRVVAHVDDSAAIERILESVCPPPKPVLQTPHDPQSLWTNFEKVRADQQARAAKSGLQVTDDDPLARFTMEQWLTRAVAQIRAYPRITFAELGERLTVGEPFARRLAELLVEQGSAVLIEQTDAS